MTRAQLVGTRKLMETRLPGEQQPSPRKANLVMRLNPDGTAETQTTIPSGKVAVEQATWEFVDERHWKLNLITPPAPFPTLEHGTVDVSDFEVQSFTGDRMELTLFDYEFAFVYERVH